MDKLHYKPAPRPKPAHETHDSIASQTAAFIRHGGRIKTIPSGYTGFTTLASPRQLGKIQTYYADRPPTDAHRSGKIP